MNIFKNIKFGDKFLTRNNKIAICINPVKFVFAIFDENTSVEYIFNTNEKGYYLAGESNDYDIIMKDNYIDEDKLDELAWNNIPNGWGDCQEHGYGTGDYEPTENHSIERECFVEGFKNGYHKAKGE